MRPPRETAAGVFVRERCAAAMVYAAATILLKAPIISVGHFPTYGQGPAPQSWGRKRW